MTTKNTTQTVTASYGDRTVPIDLHPIEGDELTTDQACNALRYGATHYFVTRDQQHLPKYQHAALTDAGWEYVKIGYTTFRSSTWGARKLSTQNNPEIHQSA